MVPVLPVTCLISSGTGTLLKKLCDSNQWWKNLFGNARIFQLCFSNEINIISDRRTLNFICLSSLITGNSQEFSGIESGPWALYWQNLQNDKKEIYNSTSKRCYQLELFRIFCFLPNVCCFRRVTQEHKSMKINRDNRKYTPNLKYIYKFPLLKRV